MNALLRNGFRIGDWVVHPIEGTIVSGDASRHLEPKVMDVLVCLAETPGKLRERDEILSEVWGERAVSDEPLTRCIATLRRELGDDQRNPTFIQTVPKRGYRLVADVQPVTDTDNKQSWQFMFPGAAILAVIATLVWFLLPGSSPRDDTLGSLQQPVKIAVAGLTSTDNSPDANMLAASFSGQLASLLNRSGVVEALGVVTSSMPREKLATIGATAVLNGRLDWTDEALSIDVELSDLDGNALWSRNFSGQAADVFAIQNQIVADLAVLSGTGPQNIASLSIASGGTDVDVYKTYLQLRHRLMFNQDVSAEEAREVILEAIAMDPEYAEPYVDLAIHYQTTAARTGDRDHHFLDLAVAACKKAVDLDPGLARAHAAQAMNYLSQGEWGLARTSLDIAVSLTRGHAETEQISWAFANLGHHDEARRWARSYFEFDPFQPSASGTYGLYHSFAGGDPAEAMRGLLMAKEQVGDIASWTIGTVALADGRIDDAEVAWQAGWAYWGMDPDLATPIAAAIRDASLTDAAVQAIEASLAAGRTREESLPWLYSYIGDADRVFEIASKLAAKNALNPTPFWYTHASYLRADPRYLETMQLLGLVDYWRSHGWPDHCRPTGDTAECS